MSFEFEMLQLFCYGVFITAIFAYAALDGFDIGVGCLHLFVKTDYERRIFLNAIGPVWDGNSLWVVITMGALLTGFPKAFATLFSGLFMPMLLLISGYVMRSVAIEFRSKMSSTTWRSSWDRVFAIASYLLAFGFGVLIANLITGLPIDAEGQFVAGFSSLFPPYAILFGLFTTSLFMLHGALFLNMKTEGDLHAKMKKMTQNVLLVFLFLWATITILTLIYEPEMTEIFRSHPEYLLIVFLALIGIVAIPKCLAKRYDGFAFLSSFLIIASLVGTYALGTFPAVVKAQDPIHSLTITNASASLMTLQVFFWVALFGVPLFIFYALCTYKVFRGKVEVDTMSY